MKSSKKTISLRVSIGAFFSVLLLFIGISVLTVTWIDSKQTLLKFSDELIEQVAATTREQVNDFLKGPAAAVIQTRQMAFNGALEMDRVDSLEACLFSMIESRARVSMIGWGNENGDFLMVKRQQNGALFTKHVNRDHQGKTHVIWKERVPGASRNDYIIKEDRKDQYDPRQRPWYTAWKNADQKKNQIYWTDVYVFHADKLPGITASLPLCDRAGHLKGVFALDISLKDLSDFVRGLKVGQNGQVIILDKKENLVATPWEKQSVKNEIEKLDTEPVLLSLKEAPDPVVSTMADSPDFIRSRSLNSTENFNYVYRNERHLATLVPIDTGPRWCIAVTVPENDFLGDVKKTMLHATYLIIALVAVAIIVGLKSINALSRPLQSLVKESERIRALDFSGSASTDSRFKEIHEVLQAFDNMKTGLRSFGRYVPQKLVELMLKRKIEPQLGGEIREMTILFSDIRRFTTITEEMGDRLAIKLGGYFSAVTQIIQADDSQGIVDKYVGDSVVAFWGAPEPVEDHCLKACRVVFRCIEAINEHQKDWEGTIPFYTCFGLHTDRVTVGNFGSQERFDYTCIGDGVNLAARLEQINKYYGTQVIVSESVWQKVNHVFESRLLDLVAVKGKKNGVRIYELLGEKGYVSEVYLEKARLYEEGFSLYLEKYFERAEIIFKQLLEKFPHDKSIEGMFKRCHDYCISPPPVDWCGIHVMESK